MLLLLILCEGCCDTCYSYWDPMLYGTTKYSICLLDTNQHINSIDYVNNYSQVINSRCAGIQVSAANPCETMIIHHSQGTDTLTYSMGKKFFYDNDHPCCTSPYRVEFDNPTIISHTFDTVFTSFNCFYLK